MNGTLFHGLIAASMSVGVLLALPAAAETAEAPDAGTSDRAESAEKPKKTRYTESVVVTASRKETPIEEAPSAVSVIGADEIETAPADDYADLLRDVPGINVVQFNAADVQFNTRQAAGNLAQGQQILVDNRSVIYDFNGIMTPAAIPVDPDDIDRIEVVRGPGSAIWGAGATNGVVHILTKRPRDTEGTRVRLGFGELGTAYGSVSHSEVVGDFAFRVTGSFFEQDDPYDRPTGTIPGTEGPANVGGTPYPPFPNEGTRQPKLDLRADWDLGARSELRAAVGIAAFSGVAHTPVGPYSWDDDSNSWYGQIEWRRDSLEVRAHATVLDVDGHYLLVPDPSGAGLLRAAFAQESYLLEAVDTRLVGDRHVLTYGANAKASRYDVEIAPEGDSRDEFGAFVQDDIRLGERWRWLLGVRVDDIETMGTAISPRNSLMFEAAPGQIVRLSWNRSFRAPTIVQTYIELFNAYDVTVPDGMGGTVDLVVPLPSTTNTDLREESLESLELGWVGAFGDRSTLTLSVYRDDLDDVIQFVPAAFYDSSNPVPGWPLDPALLDVPPPDGFAGLFPALLQYRNIGEIRNRGVEASAEVGLGPEWSAWTSASWQDDPEVRGIRQVPRPDGTFVYPVNFPPRWRVSAGVRWDDARYWIDASGNYQSSAFWTDVLDSRFWGPTEAFTQFHVGAGVRLRDGKMALSVRAQNVTNERVQHHVWGDLLGRKVVGQMTLRF